MKENELKQELETALNGLKLRSDIHPDDPHIKPLIKLAEQYLHSEPLPEGLPKKLKILKIMASDMLLIDKVDMICDVFMSHIKWLQEEIKKKDNRVFELEQLSEELYKQTGKLRRELADFKKRASVEELDRFLYCEMETINNCDDISTPFSLNLARRVSKHITGEGE